MIQGCEPTHSSGVISVRRSARTLLISLQDFLVGDHSMAILAWGLNHASAPLELRERIAFPDEQLAEAVRRLCDGLGQVAEAAILSTCNRTEIYCVTETASHESVLSWLAANRDVGAELLSQTTYAHWNVDAVRHLMRVASGLDSQVLGEPQIMGQVKSAYDVAKSAGTLGPELSRMSQLALATAKRVRTDTEIGRHPISVAYAAVGLARQIFGDLAKSQVLLLGAGETIELVVRHLKEAGVSKLVVANRTLARAQELTALLGGEAVTLGQLPEALEHSDVVIASTGSPTPLLGKGTAEEVLKRRKHRPIFMLDIAVPRDIEPQVAELRDVYLYTIDDLTAIIEENVRNRNEAARAAELLIDEGVLQYVREQRIRDVQDVVTQFRDQAETVRAEELAKALKRLASGGEPAEVIEQLTRNLTNKLIHKPTVGIRSAGAEGRDDLIEWLQELFNLKSGER